MAKKLKNIAIAFLALAIIIGNKGIITNLFAQTDIEKENISTEYKLDKVTDLRVTMKNSDYIKLEWRKVKGANGYRIYRSATKNGIFRRINEVDGKTACYIDKNLDSGTNYYYKVKAFKSIEDKIYSGCPSDILDATTCPPEVKDLHANCISNSFVELNWQTVYKSSGYEVYRSTIKNGDFKRIAMLTDNGKSCFKDNNLKSRKKYYYKVRAFKELNGQICFGNYSDVLTICTEK